jgi:hypothetical protein
MDELAKLLGLGPPVVAAGAIYWLFSFFDKKASDEANQTLTSWMKGGRYKQIDLGNAVIGAFDHLYSAPLFRWKAFRRSALLSLCAILIYNAYFLYEKWHPLLPDLQVYNEEVWTELWTSGYLTRDLVRNTEYVAPQVIIFDYLSLYVVRSCLKIARKSATWSILFALFFGALAISVFFILSLILGMTFFSDTDAQAEFVLRGLPPACLVHLWLPLFLIGALLNSGLRAFFRAAGLAQRFIKHGDTHPFDAIGIVAATVVFVVTTVWTIGSHFI